MKAIDFIKYAIESFCFRGIGISEIHEYFYGPMDYTYEIKPLENDEKTIETDSMEEPGVCAMYVSKIDSDYISHVELMVNVPSHILAASDDVRKQHAKTLAANLICMLIHPLVAINVFKKLHGDTATCDEFVHWLPTLTNLNAGDLDIIELPLEGDNIELRKLYNETLAETWAMLPTKH